VASASQVGVVVTADVAAARRRDCSCTSHGLTQRTSRRGGALGEGDTASGSRRGAAAPVRGRRGTVAGDVDIASAERTGGGVGATAA